MGIDRQIGFKSWAYFGGLCNILMTLKIDKATINFIEDQLGYISYQHIRQFASKLSPTNPGQQENPFQKLYHSILHEIKQNRDKNIKEEIIKYDIVSRAAKINEQFGFQLRMMLENQFFKKNMQKDIRPLTSVTVQVRQKSPAQKWADNIDRYIQAFEKRTSPIAQNTTSVQKGQNILGRLSESKQVSETCSNLLNRPQCLCQNIKQISKRDESSFRCVHCNRIYHTVCMRKRTTSQFCCYCHLEKMMPLKKSVRTVFIGLLKKSKKKHMATFQIPEIESHQKLELRCLRLKEDAQQGCLFPDVAQLSMNGQRCHLFQPINKQSCLKYRKDQPCLLQKGMYYKGQDNQLQVSEAVAQNRQRDIRNDAQNHLIGLYVIEYAKIEKIIDETRIQNTLGFSQSHDIMQNSFGLGKDDEITCQIVKIPLLCPLTTVKIQIPARGYYCTHFQCFDLKNYLTLISESTNPRWKCPLCNAMAFQLKIDSILMEILKETKSNDKIKQILFFKNGDYSAIVDEEPLPQRKNIRALQIPEKLKKPLFEPEPIAREKPRKKPNFFIPENAQIIPLDD